MQPHSSELDPSIEIASSIERHNHEENQRREEINRILSEERVPTYDQLLAAKEWSADLRSNGNFDNDGNLLQNDGLEPVNIDLLNQVDSYFSEEKWALGKKEMVLAVEISHQANRINSGGLLGVIEKTSPSLAKELSESLDGLGTLERIDKLEAAKSDISALVKLNAGIERGRRERGAAIPATDTDKRSENYSAEEKRLNDAATEESEKLIKAGLLGINVDVALKAIEDAVAAGENIDFVSETVSGLSHSQKSKLLEHYGYKQKAAPAPEINPKTLRAVPTNGERIRRFVNGTQTKPAVTARHSIENKGKLAQRRLDADDALPDNSTLKLSDRKRSRLEKRIGKSQAKIRDGSRLNPNKYGTANKGSEVDADSQAFTRANIESSLLQLKRAKESIALQRESVNKTADGHAFDLIRNKIDSALNRSITPVSAENSGPVIALNKESFNAILEEIGKNFDEMLQDKINAAEGRRLSDSEIESVYIESQLKLARELADLDLRGRGIDKASTQYASRVRQILEALHSYTPEDTANQNQQTSSSTRPTPNKMPQKSSQSRKEAQRRAEKAVADNAARTAIDS